MLNKKLFIISMIFLLIMSIFSISSYAEEVELTFWHDWTGAEAADKEVLLPKIEEFQKNNPNIKLDVQVIPHNDYMTKVLTQAAGGQLPDIMKTWPGARLEPIIEAGLLMPLDEIAEYWTDELIPESSLSAHTFNGKLYAIPSKTNYTHIIYYDKDILESVGYSEFPESYEDFKKMANKLKEKDITPIGLGNKAPWVLQSVYLSTIVDRIAGKDFLNQVLAGEKKLTNPDFIKSLEIIKELADNGYFNKDANSLDNNQIRESFYQGKAAMFVGGLWDLGGVIENTKGTQNVGFATFPSIEGEKAPKALSGVTGGALSLNSNLTSEQKEAAFKFLKFLYSRDTFKKMLGTSSIIPPANVEIPNNVNPQFKDVVNLVNQHEIAPVIDSVFSSDMSNTINNGLQSLIEGNITPEELAKELQDNM